MIAGFETDGSLSGMEASIPQTT